jgi:hypothetical protein
MKPASQESPAVVIGATEARLRRAYDSTQLRQNGITFERALESPHFAVALVNIAARLTKEPSECE